MTSQTITANIPTTKPLSQPIPTVPFLDLRAAYIELKDEIDAAVSRVLNSGWYLLGEELAAFESEFAGYVETRDCVGVSSGLDALQLALRALNVRPGDEVLVPSNTYIATWLAVSSMGATPVPVEPDPATYNIDPERIPNAISSRTRGIIPVHLYGQPADMDPILEIAKEHQLWVLEDAAQAHGARYKGRPVGGLGHVAAWSFYPGKNLGAMSDGGAVTTNDDAIAERVRMLRNYGSKIKYHFEERGINSRLDEVQAAILRVKLGHLDDWNRRRSRVANIYQQQLRDINLVLPYQLRCTDAAHHLYVIRSTERDALSIRLRQRGIMTLVHYPIPPHLQPAYDDSGWRRGSLPISEEIHDEVLSLPMGPHLASSQVDAVVEAVRDAVQ